MKELNIVHLFPDLLNLYGDKGNIAVLKKRCLLRDINANIVCVNANDELKFSDADIILLGGGGDKEQKIAGDILLKYQKDFESYRDDMGSIIAICGGYELIGSHYYCNNEKKEGLSLCDIYTEQNEKRFTGNIAIQTQYGVCVGFENHSGCTYIGANVTPFGTVIRGYGNNGEDKTEGIVYKNMIGTYIHGPLLPKNPEIADLLIKRAVERKYGENIELNAVDDFYAEQAKSYILDVTIK